MNEPGKGEQLEESDDLFVSESCKGSFWFLIKFRGYF
jgi:hypothetical protein